MVDGNTIAAIARANLGKMYNSINSAGSTGYYTSTTGEPWCADFAKWVWYEAGVDVGGLTPGAISFADYGELGGTPHVGDAVVFGANSSRSFAQHVAIVVEVQGGNIYSIGGDEGAGSPPQNSVQQDGLYPAAVGYSSYMQMNISGYVTPRGLTAVIPESADPDMSTQSSNGVVSLSFKPGSISHLQITTDPATGPLPLRVMLALPTGPWIQNGGGGSAGDYTVSNGFATYSIAPAYVGACGGVMLESTQPNRVFSAVGF